MTFEAFACVCDLVERNKSELAPYSLPLVPQITLIKASHLNFLTKQARLWSSSQEGRSQQKSKGRNEVTGLLYFFNVSHHRLR